MNDLPIEATVIDGQIRLPAGICLPENAKVFVILPDGAGAPPARIPSPRLRHADQAELFQMEVRKP